MKFLEKYVTERMKFITLLLGTIVCVATFVLFCFRIPSTGDYGGIPVVKAPSYVAISTGDVFTQEFTSSVDQLETISVLFTRDGKNGISGNVLLEVLNEEGQLIGKYEYTADMIPPTNYVAVPISREEESKGKKYILKISFLNFENKDNLSLAYVNDENNSPYIKNGDINVDSLVISYLGKKGDKSFFWYPFMGIALLIPLYAMIDYSKIKRKGKENEN